jgi:hypothetical protein
MTEPVRAFYQQRELKKIKVKYSLLKLTLDETTDLILDLLKNNPATIVIHALNKYDPLQRNDLFYALDRIIQELSSLVRVLVLSHNDNDIIIHLKQSPNIYIVAHNNFEDIKAFALKELTASILRRKILSGNVSLRLRDLIIAALLESA